MSWFNRLSCFFVEALHAIYLVRYTNLAYEIAPSDNREIIQIRVRRSSGLWPFRRHRYLQAYRLKPSLFRHTCGFRWNHSGEFTPGMILERLEMLEWAKLEHSRIMLTAAETSAPVERGTASSFNPEDVV